MQHIIQCAALSTQKETEMKNLSMILAAVAMLAISVPATEVSASPSACLDGTAPEGWLRAGGYCETVKAPKTLAGALTGYGGGCAPRNLKTDSFGNLVCAGR